MLLRRSGLLTAVGSRVPLESKRVPLQRDDEVSSLFWQQVSIDPQIHDVFGNLVLNPVCREEFNCRNVFC